MSNQNKKRKIFSSDSESDNENEIQQHLKNQDNNSTKEPTLQKKLKKTTDDVNEFQKKLEVANQINAVKKDNLVRYLEEQDEKLSPKKKTLIRQSGLTEAKKDHDDIKKEEDVDGDDEGEDQIKKEEEDDDDDNDQQGDKEDSEEEGDQESDNNHTVKTSRYRHQSYDQDSTIDKESSFDGFYSFKDDDDFYVQANKSRQQESQQEKEINKLVEQRNGKIISKSRGYIFTVICFKNHVFDADIENIIKKWCPQCHILHQEYSQYAISQQGELESQFFQPKLNFRCKFYHKWCTPELNCIKLKQWCPKCPDVLNLMINHHHKGVVSDEEKIEQISEQAELLADGYQVTNPKSEQSFELLKDLYFILLVPLQLYSRYLQSFKIEDQTIEFKKKEKAMNPEHNSHPLAQKITDKLYKMFRHLFQSSDDEEENVDVKQE